MMDKKQFSVIIAALKSNYRNFGVDTKEQIEFWYEMLKDIDYQILELAVKKLISEMVYPPTIADIRKAAAETVEPNFPDSAEAWGEVLKAIQYYGSYNKEKALDSMSKLTRRVVEGMGWQQLCLSENQMADRAHFLRMYEALVDREKKDRALPIPLKEDMKKLQNNKSEINTRVLQLLENKSMPESMPGGNKE